MRPGGLDAGGAGDAHLPRWNLPRAGALPCGEERALHRGADARRLRPSGGRKTATVFEGGGRQRTVPLEVALVFDTSGSVTDNGLLDAAAFKAGLLDTVPNARIAVYSFARHLRRYTPPTRDFAALQFALGSLAERRSVNGVEIALELPPKRKTTANGASWIYEAVMGTARDLSAQPAGATRMIVIFSDGLPTTSTSPEDAASVCEELGRNSGIRRPRPAHRRQRHRPAGGWPHDAAALDRRPGRPRTLGVDSRLHAGVERRSPKPKGRGAAARQVARPGPRR